MLKLHIQPARFFTSKEYFAMSKFAIAQLCGWEKKNYSLKINKKLLIEAEHFSDNCRENTDSPLDLAMFNEYKCRWLGIYSTLPERVKTILHDLQNYSIAEVKLKNGLSDSQYYRMINSVMTIVENKVFCESKS